MKTQDTTSKLSIYRQRHPFIAQFPIALNFFLQLIPSFAKPHQSLAFRPISLATCILFCAHLSMANERGGKLLLSIEDSIELRAWADTVAIRDAIGQIFITGIHDDIGAYLKSSLNHELISSIGVGGVIIHNYDLLPKSKGEVRPLVRFDTRSFLEHLQRQARLPLFVTMDFEESLNLRTVIDAAGLMIPPSLLTLAMTHDSAIIRNTGYYVGMQMNLIGANLLLGPVIDADLNVIGKDKSQLGSRTFGANRHFNARAAVIYTKGLDSAGIASISKHYPGCGSKETKNPHDNISYYGGHISEALPDAGVVAHSAGIMTSHICIKSIDSSIPATFSRIYVSDLLRSDAPANYDNEQLNGSGVFDKLIITDDLSGMAGVVNTEKKNGAIDYPTIARKAFDAGHDILLFSHIENSPNAKLRRSKHGMFTFARLRETLDSMVAYISSSPNAEQQFRHSLFRIASAKLNLFRGRVSSFGEPSRAITWNDINASKHDSRDEAISTLENSLLQDAYDSSVVELTDRRISLSFDGNQEVLYFADTSICNQLPARIAESPSTTVKCINSKKTGLNIRHWISEHQDMLDSADVIIITISSPDYAMIFDALTRKYKSVIGLLHTHPQYLTPYVIDTGRGYIFGNLGTAREAYLSDFKVLLNNLHPKPRSGMCQGQMRHQPA